MDPGGLGAIIGIGIMAVCFSCFKFHDILEKRKKCVSVETPLLVSQSPSFIKPPSHWKVKDLFQNQGKTILLKNLSSMTASRNLVTTIK